MGNDEVHPRVLKENSIAKPLSLLFIKSYRTGEVPKEMREANVTPLHNKGSKLEAANFRPVSLTSVVCKIMELIIKDVIFSHLLNNNLISKCQHRFIPNKSCVTNLLETLDFLSQSIHMKKAIDIIYLDFCKAFDKVPHKRLIYKLRCYGLNDKLIELIQAFLTGRRQRVVLGKACSSWKEVISGVPQGSVLGPIFLLFL
ncbi:unnamed protein product [Brachionus calyciflorus]|uniref:Reverse transcriptase domain-containing protein n=1 Tax=Brachionus calyciflorus TaxID=104777 RepID=A0A814NGA5_9BILA|nr:unnamed protein product [Brachionus calyciflorus]